MKIFNSVRDYGTVAPTLHWCTVVLVALAWALGTFDDVLPKVGPRASGLFVHILAGLAIVALLAARVVWRMIDKPPSPEPGRLGVWPHRLAMLAHLALYALLLAVPVVGIVLQFARGEPLPLFGLMDIASPWPGDRAFARSVKEVHEVLAHALVIIAALHALAAMMHHWIFRDRTLVRMLPHSGE